MKRTLDSTYLTVQRDLFESGLVAQIGPNSFSVWNAIKCHADFNTGLCFPGMRSIGKKVGLSPASVQRAITCLIDHHLLRIVSPHGKKRGQTYIARERLDVKVGGMVVCTVVMDYIPTKISSTLDKLKKDFAEGRSDAFSLVEIIPGKGFDFDASTGNFKKEIKVNLSHQNRSVAGILKGFKKDESFNLIHKQ